MWKMAGANELKLRSSLLLVIHQLSSDPYPARAAFRFENASAAADWSFPAPAEVVPSRSLPPPPPLLSSSNNGGLPF